MANKIDSLISAVSAAASFGSLCDAYMAARRPCIEAGRMADLIAANDAAEARLGDQEIAPLVGIDHYGLVVPR